MVQKAPIGGVHEIPTKSSRPLTHPNQLSNEMVDKIIEYKLKFNRCSEVIHKHLENDGIEVSLSSVKRKLEASSLKHIALALVEDSKTHNAISTTIKFL